MAGIGTSYKAIFQREWLLVFTVEPIKPLNVGIFLEQAISGMPILLIERTKVANFIHYNGIQPDIHCDKPVTADANSKTCHG